MNKPDEFMAVATPGGDVIRRRAKRVIVGFHFSRGRIEHRTPELQADELLLERMGKIPMIIKAYA
jgi:hypothetical protein